MIRSVAQAAATARPPRAAGLIVPSHLQMADRSHRSLSAPELVSAWRRRALRTSCNKTRSSTSGGYRLVFRSATRTRCAIALRYWRSEAAAATSAPSKSAPPRRRPCAQPAQLPAKLSMPSGARSFHEPVVTALPRAGCAPAQPILTQRDSRSPQDDHHELGTSSGPSSSGTPPLAQTTASIAALQSR